MTDTKKPSAKEVTALRRAALFNIKARNIGVRDLFSEDSQREKKLEIERQKIAVTLMTKAGVQNIDEFLVRVTKKEPEVKK